ncbi:MAG TPA: type II toxin-antitoxin system VapC family toxin [Candidatus Bathyarchaeia archaeon]|nr:type II toxin-antitoxin system VapC family toxin [Candidatus Bathyarchaeia archaeon]
MLKMSTPHYSFVIDTYAWVQYLLGSSKGKKAREYIEGGRGATPTIVLLKLRKWYLREIEAGRQTLVKMNEAFEYVQSSTMILDIDRRLALEAGETDFVMKKKKPGWPLADSIVYAAAKVEAATVVTGDPHFDGLENVIML